MKYHILLFTFLSSAVSAQVTVECISSASDSDGDGYGWENNTSCIVSNTTPSTPGTDSVCIDSDGDGWGWNGVASCVVDSNETNGTNIEETEDTDTQQSGMARELVGVWNCYSGIMSQETWAVSNTSYELEGAPAWAGGCVQFDTVRRGPLTSSQCDIHWTTAYQATSASGGQFNAHLSRLVLNDDLSGTLQEGYYEIYDNVNFDGGVSRYVDPVAITWKLEGFQFSVNGNPLHRIAFETYQGSEYFSYYDNDENRTTCKK